MRIKKIHVGFDIDMEVFLQMVAHGNSGMKIEVFGAEPPKPKRQVVQEKPALLEGPKPTLGEVVSKFMLEHKDRAIGIKELQELSTKHGFSPTSAQPTMQALRKKGLVKRVSPGLFQVTDKLVGNHG
jgi:hypothetical protein